MKLDLHVHTKYSNDGLNSPSTILKCASKKGLDGIAITDHNTTKGWQEAIKAAKKMKKFLILGEEIRCKEGVDVLGLWLKKEIKPAPFKKVIKEIRKQNALAIFAHPFAKKLPLKTIEKFAKEVDALEIFNSRRRKKYNEKALELAKKLKKPVVGGSDAHTFFEVGRTYTESKAKDLKEFRKNILEKKAKVKGKTTTSLVHLISTILKIKKFFNSIF